MPTSAGARYEGALLAGAKGLVQVAGLEPASREATGFKPAVYPIPPHLRAVPRIRTETFPRFELEPSAGWGTTARA